MSKSFDTNLDPADKTFTELKSGLKTGKYPWWNYLKENKDISIQIRKENTIDVYYNGGAVLKELKYNNEKKTFTASIHPKYIPLKSEDEYIPLTLSSKGVEFTEKIDLMELAQLEETQLKAVTKRIKKYHDSVHEKAIQYKFANNDPYIIDTEFQAKGTESQAKKPGLRIDLVRLDKNKEKIVLIEVKRMGDERLFADPKENKKAKENIYDQLKKYHEFAVDYQESIRAYYIKVLKIKNDLEISKPEVKEIDLTDWQVETKPLLVFGDCTQDWIDKKAAIINGKIKSVAYGVYYSGSPKCPLDLIAKPKRNRYIF